MAVQEGRLSTRDDYEGATSVAAPFVIELWGGSLINGQIKEAVLPVKVREQTWRIPLSDVLEVVSPTPRISDETRQRIAALPTDDIWWSVNGEAMRWNNLNLYKFVPTVVVNRAGPVSELASRPNPAIGAFEVETPDGRTDS